MISCSPKLLQQLMLGFGILFFFRLSTPVYCFGISVLCISMHFRPRRSSIVLFFPLFYHIIRRRVSSNRFAYFLANNRQ
uniref:Uncharacterized protein n=1 Tax=Anopheles darlingi TaxID=43151 RepID=A0A2M4D872_ANODA